jgi:site-specific recombinase XerD
MTRSTYRKIIVNDETLKQINPQNKKLQERFLKEKNIRSSDLTIKNYDSDLNIFFTWVLLYCDNKFFVDLKKLEFSEFFSFCVNELKWNSARFSRVRSVLSVLSQFVEKFYDQEYPGYRNCILNAVEGMPKTPSREKTVMSEEQVEMVFQKIKDFPQISLWLSLALSSGGRFSELLRFTTDSISLDNTAFDGIFLETVTSLKTKGRTKAGKMLKKYILKQTFIDHYTRWLPIRQEIMLKNNIEHNSIFINEKTGEPVKTGEVRGWVKKIEDALGENFYPHCARHWLTTKLSKVGLPYSLIAFIFGWDGISMCSIYDDQNAKDRQWSELDNLKLSLQK